MLRTTTTAAAIALFATPLCWAGDDHAQTLTIGDKAPAIDVGHWLKGKEVAEFEPGRIYVLEFWATWCSPCRASIPHVSKLQEAYEDYDVTFIGVSDERLQTVVKFLCRSDPNGTLWNEKIQYTLATDPDLSVPNAYKKPAGRDGIPVVFIIGKDSRVEWIGGPMEMDDVLEAVVHDRWDRDAFRPEYEKEVAPVRKAIRLMARMDASAQDGDWKGAIAAIDDLIKEQPGYDRLKTKLFRKMLRQADPAQTYAYGRRIMREHWDHAGTLNAIAWSTVDDKEVKKRDIAFAMEAAKRANELTDGESAAILDTVARVYYEKGDLESAIKWQRKAIDHASDATADLLGETLEEYEKEAAR